MPLSKDDLIRLKLLKLLQARHGLMTQEETLLFDSGVIRLEPHIMRLVADMHVLFDQEHGVYRLTDAGRQELARLQGAGGLLKDGEETP